MLATAFRSIGSSFRQRNDDVPIAKSHSNRDSKEYRSGSAPETDRQPGACARDSEHTSEKSSKVEIPSLLKHSSELFRRQDTQNL